MTLPPLLFLAPVLLARAASAASGEDEVELHAEDPGEPTDAESGELEEDGASSEGGTEQEPPGAPDTGHGGQFGLRLGLAAGYRMMFRYAESPFCGPPGSQDGESCSYGAPLSTDLALSFAPLDALELFAWARFGMARESKTDTDAVRVFGAGVRLYTMSDAPLKVFVQPAVAWSFEGGGRDPAWRARGGTEPDYRSDLLLHFSVGPQYDFNRHVGMYASAGMTVGALRALSATLEGTLGVQGRYP